MEQITEKRIEQEAKPIFRIKLKYVQEKQVKQFIWLELIDELNWEATDELIQILKEAKEILAIFSSISKKLK